MGSDVEPLDHFTVEGDCACFRPEGDATWQTLVALLERAMSRCEEAKVKKLLVNVALLRHTPLTVTDRFGLATDLARIWDRSIRMAFVVRPDHRDKKRFVQLVAQNRGLLLGVAGTEEEGLSWLGSPKE